jgi:enoyl-CoA hydratase/carnithine racemase
VAEKDLTVAAALQMAGKICANAPLAVRESLMIARRALDFDESALRQMSYDAQDRITQTADFLEGPRAFIEKRNPNWLGR